MKHELAIQEFRRQAEEQPKLLKLQWRRQLSQKSSYKAEIHELYTEMLNMREKSEMKSRLSAQMRRLETPSRSVESEPENVLNTASPGRCSSWILASEMTSTPNRPTTSGLQSPSGAPMQFDPSPATQEYRHQSPCCVTPAQWGNHYAGEPGEEECDLFGGITGASPPSGNPIPPTTPPTTPPGNRATDPWASFSMRNRCSKFGMTSLRLPSPPGEGMLREIGSLKC